MTASDFTSLALASLLARRNFLGRGLRMGAGSAAFALLQKLGANAALAQPASDYKALVCVFLAGGYDGHNALIPLEPAKFEAYARLRTVLALERAGMHEIATKNADPYGLHPSFTALTPHWGQKKLAVVANMGVLAEPTTRATYIGTEGNKAKLPSNLFSHADQVLQMQTGNATGGGGTGWAGRAGDAVNAANAQSDFPAAFALNGAATFGTGDDIRSASLWPDFGLAHEGLGAPTESTQRALQNAYTQILNLNSGVGLVHAADKVRRDAVQLRDDLERAKASTPLQTVFPNSNIARQLQQAANIIHVRDKTKLKRQIFFCSFGSFDTHANQAWFLADQLQQLSEALAAFYAATEEMGLVDNVTTFTQSDFGRTLQASGSGSDHGWGNHHFILGGAVNGGDVYGQFPDPVLEDGQDATGRGVLIPTTALDQYGATLAKWFGVDAAGMTKVFPNLPNFAKADLGFMG